MLHKTYKLFNQSTRQAYFERVRGYVVKSYNKGNEIAALMTQHKLSKCYRFDLGENVLGFPPMVYQFLLRFQYATKEGINLNNYPEVVHAGLRRRIAEKHNVDSNRVVISTGLDAILDLISRVFFDPKDYYISIVPSFFLFEDYSERMGAIPIFLRLNEADEFRLTPEKVEELKELIVKFKPKIIWIANPNNPTGVVVPKHFLADIIQFADAYNVFVVVDEAYIEFLPNVDDLSVMDLTRDYLNLLVLRSFSKVYGLAGMRVGYLISYSKDVIDALLMLRTHFPVTQLAVNMAGLALKDDDFLVKTRRETEILRNELFIQLNAFESFVFVPTSTNIFLLKNKYLSDKELDLMFKKKGIICSFVNFSKAETNKFLRITIRERADNEYFLKICQWVDAEVGQRKNLVEPKTMLP